MSNYNSLKATIDANIKQNGNQEITGQILNSVLNAMVTTLGTGYQFAGVATIATNPGTPDAKVFYIANGKGTYEKFGGLEVTEDDVVVFYWDSSWHKVATGIASQEKLSELESEIGTLKVINIANPSASSWQKTNVRVVAGIPYRFTCTVGRIAGQRIMDGNSILESLSVNIPAGETKVITFTQSGELLFYCVNEGEVEVYFCNSTGIKENISTINSTTSYLLNFFPHQIINSRGEIIPSPNVAVSELIKVDSNKNILVTTGHSQVAQYIILYDDSGYLDYYSVTSESSSREINTLNASYIQFGFSLKDINIVSVKDGENTIWKPKNNELIENRLKIIEENILKNNSTIDSIIGNYPNYIENSIINELGIINSHATFSTSPLINIAAATVIKIFYGTIAEPSFVVFYDENKKIIDYFTLASTDTSRYIPNEGYSYARFSFNKTGLIKNEKDNILWESMVFSDKIKDNSDKVNYIINYTPDTTISLNGNISKLKGIALSEYIPVNREMSYLCTYGYNVEGAIILYDANKQYLDYYTIALMNNQREINVAGASYLRMPFNLLNIKDIQITLNGEVVWKPNYYSDIYDRVEMLYSGKDNRHTYDGEPIILQSLEYYTMFVNPHQGMIQDACCYQNTMFQFFLQETYDNPACIVYDLITGEKIQEMDVPHGYYSHNNSAVFGSEKYNESDEFPLLYLSTLQRVTGQPAIDVFRITGTKGSYQCELVQTITIEKAEPSYREPTCFIDKQANMLYVAWITGEVDTFEKYSLPKLSDGNNIVIPVSSKLDTFTASNRYPYGTTIGDPEQGGEIYNGKLYYAMGFKSCAWLIVIDLQKKEIVSSIDFTGIGLDYEPEGAFVWNGYLCVPFNESGKVVRFSFM